MTQKQIDEYTKRYEAEYYLCWCGKKASQIAHRICSSKTNYKVYGKEVIDNNINLVPVCCLEHNDKVNIGNKIGTSKKLVQLIKSRGDDILTVREINEYLEV
jgi:hypothetical protein